MRCCTLVQVHIYVMMLFQFHTFKPGLIIAFNDACHLLRFALRPRRLSFGENKDMLEKSELFGERYHLHMPYGCARQQKPCY